MEFLSQSEVFPSQLQPPLPTGNLWPWLSRAWTTKLQWLPVRRLLTGITWLILHLPIDISKPPSALSAEPSTRRIMDSPAEALHQKSEPSMSPSEEKALATAEISHVDNKDELGNLTYGLVDEEPEVHFRTYLATAAMFLLNLVQVVALLGPPVAVCCCSFTVTSRLTSYYS